MKTIFKSIAFVVMSGALLLSTSCTDAFLKETKRDAASSDYLDSPEGLYSMSMSLYGVLQDYFGRATWNYIQTGTDEMTAGSDTQGEAWNSYDARINASSTAGMWDPYYYWIGRCNVVLSREKAVEGSSLKNETLGTAYFFRAFCYLFLVSQFGDVPLKTEPSGGPEREFVRASREEVYKVIIQDLEAAYAMLTSDVSVIKNNKLDKYTAAHYLAKAHLWRASEINADWNKNYEVNDLAECIKYADIVIAAHPIVAEYNDLFNNFTTYDNSITETNSEILLAMGNSANEALGRIYGGDYYQMYIPWYENFALMKRDIPGGRPYQRMKPSPRYAYYIYDLENDSRLWKSMRMTFAVNKCATVSSTSTLYFSNGETAVAKDYFPNDEGEYLSTMFIINRADYGQKYYKDEVIKQYNATPKTPYSRIDYRTGKFIPALAALLVYDEPGGSDDPIGTCMIPRQDERLYCSISKFIDGATPEFTNGSFRDVVTARSAEDYFFKAEALVRQGKYNEGLAAVQPIRERAQFKAGEERDHYVDGGQAYFSNQFRASLSGLDHNCSYYPQNSYYYSIGGWDDPAYRAEMNAKASVLPLVTTTSYPKEDLYVINALGYTSDYDKALCFLLNEKSRETYGELIRWQDLARTKTLEKRLYFNDTVNSKTMTDVAGKTVDYFNGNTYTSQYGGSFNPNKHYVRPIPQTFLDNITKDGKPLTTEEKNAMQNPGY
ncbi:MAG: RagB/SusD family nutrient uptake outer membrane protein [Bacteroidales bacterium]|nr:RagB/SusD family nutrient uptake outer membrane protein [Bacteroidales bacterium]